MSETTIKPGEFAQADPAALANLNDTAVAARPQQEMTDTLGSGGFSIRPSFLDVAYAVSPWNEGDKFGNGAFVLDREDQIAKQSEPLTVIVARKRVYWMTYPSKGLPRADFRYYANETMALRGLDTAGVQGKPEITQYPPRGVQGPMPTALEACDMELFIRRPEGCASTRFVLKLGEHWYVPARFHVNKLWRGIKDEITRMACLEAGMRGVKPSEGRIDQYLMRFWTQGEKKTAKDGGTNTLIYLRAAAVPGKNGPEPVPAEVRDALADLSRQVEQAMLGPAAAGDDDIPPVAVEL